MMPVSKEVALEEFDRLARAADVNIDSDTMSEEEAAELEEIREVLTSAIVAGDIAVDEDGAAILHTHSGEIKFRVPLGEDLMIMATARDDKRMEAMNRFVCSITGKDTRTIGKLKKKEWKLAMRLAGFLSAD